VDDLLAVYEKLSSAKIALAGFSFGAAMAAMLAQRVQVERMVLVGVAVANFKVPPVPAGTLVIHGERDDTIPLAAVLDWARPQELPVTVVPDADHFFHRKLHILRSLVEANWK
jgi:alpha/beta superfamily hydrolase